MATNLRASTELHRIRSELETERKSHQETRKLLIKKGRPQHGARGSEQEFLKITRYLNDKVTHLEKTLEQRSEGEDVKVLFPGFDDDIEALKHK